MSSMPWVKAYTEMLDDAKLLPLPEPTKWRFMQLILLAGDCDQDGWLANNMGALSVETIAMRLRVPISTLSNDLAVLQKAGLMLFDRKAGAWLVVNFSKRQGRPQSQKRELWREQKNRQRRVRADTGRIPSPVHQVDTGGVRLTEGEKEKEEELEGDKDKEGDAGAGAPHTQAKNPDVPGEAAERSINGNPPEELPAAVKIFEANGGKYARGTLIDGTSKKDRARVFISEHIENTPDSLKRWEQVVYHYCLVWSGTSYSIMVNDYYLRNRVPGEPNGRQQQAQLGRPGKRNDAGAPGKGPVGVVSGGQASEIARRLSGGN